MALMDVPRILAPEAHMRIAVGILISATTLFITGVFGLWGTWALAAATVLGLVGAVWTVTVMEERDLAVNVVAALADRRRPLAIPIEETGQEAV